MMFNKQIYKEKYIMKLYLIYTRILQQNFEKNRTSIQCSSVLQCT